MKLFMQTIIFIMICMQISLRVLLVVFVVAAVIFVSQTSFKLKKNYNWYFKSSPNQMTTFKHIMTAILFLILYTLIFVAILFICWLDQSKIEFICQKHLAKYGWHWFGMICLLAYICLIWHCQIGLLQLQF